MFENVGMPELLVLVVAGLFILGPERLPEAAAWVGRAVRQVKEFASGAQNHLKKELGPEFDQIQQPLNDLRSLRSLNPRTAITRSLFSDNDAYTPPVKPNGFAPGPGGTAAAAGAAALGGAAAPAAAPVRAPQSPLAADERPPVDPDAT
ncbi:Sec-independent protein translocase protein TatB [Pseudonocardia sp. ICBG1293]|uniref:Sec-independent protein translocase protein TatB n=1 Tax=Pseudonocardia sp. ICBG1293 TaxID=2844382 RepID=UPI001CCAB6DC|nr:Sec-independent protein translocase protein TatB [Pseudonocardia sp. ICBG1293]